MRSIYHTLKKCLAQQVPVALATVIKAPRSVGAKMLVFPDSSTQGTLGDKAVEEKVVRDAVDLLAKGTPQALTYGEIEVFIDAFPAPPTLLIFGAVHLAMPLSRFAKELGFRVIVVDPRVRFATRERFPAADEVIVAYPQEAALTMDASTFVAVLSHDPKLDEPALIRALRSRARYIGALGSRRTGLARRERLRRQGLTEEQQRRIRTPIGLDLGARTPEEEALSILAEMLAVKYGREGGPLSVREGPIHAPVL